MCVPIRPVEESVVTGLYTGVTLEGEKIHKVNVNVVQASIICINTK